MAAPLVLVVEDEPDLRDLFCLMLEQDGHRVIAVGEGRDVVDLATEHRPDLVMLDLTLPDVSGLDVLRSLRLESQVPVLVVTGLAGNEALAAGATDYVLKPFRPAELIRRVSLLLEKAS